ncbi:MAG: hypothetical protein N3A72_03610 [bacterium]|nr:hypothetical protein [bacterium]
MKKKILISLGILLLIVLLIIFIWWYSPVTRINTNQFIPAEKYIELRCMTDATHPLRMTGIKIVMDKVERQSLTGLKKSLVRFGITQAFPEEIRVVFCKDTMNHENNLLVIVDFGRGIKLVRLMKDTLIQRILANPAVQEKTVGQYSIYHINPSGKTKFKPQACIWIDSGLIISTDVNLLTGLVNGYRSEAGIIPTGNLPDVTFSIDNQNKELSFWIQEQEKKLEYSIFPTIDSIERVEGTLTMQDIDKGTGKIVFSMNKMVPPEKQAEIESDIEFFKNVLRRIVKAQDIDLTAAVTTQNNIVQVDYQLTGLSRLKL